MTSPRIVVVDIEGTVTPISFVKEILFPYSRQRLSKFVTLAKAEFSNSQNANIQKWSAYIKGDVNRQAFLERALDWVSKGDIGAYMSSHRWRVIGYGAAAGVVMLALTSFVKFDFNPLNLRSPKTESVQTLFDLMKDPRTSPYTVDVLTANAAAATDL